MLFIVTEINSANGICSLNVMRELKKKKIQLFCITNNENNKKEYEMENIKFFTIKPRLNYRLNNFSKKIKNSFYRKLFLYLINIINKFKILMFIFTWPLVSPLYSYRIFSKSKKIIKKYNIKYIVPVYSQIDTLIAANLLKRKNNDLVIIPYFLDSLSGGYGPRIFSKAKTIKRGLSWENILLCNSKKIIMMQSAYSHYQKISEKINFFKNIVFLDLPLLIPKNYNDKLSAVGQKTINIVYCGSIPSGIRSPNDFLKIFRFVSLKNIKLTFIGTLDCSALNKASLIDNRIEIIGKIPYCEIEKYEKNADILLNLGNSNPNMTPSKLFEYLSYCKPIISTCPIEDEPCIKYLNKYRLSYLVKEYNKLDYKKEGELLEKFIINNYKKRENFERISNTFNKNLPKTTANEIIRVMNERGN